MRLALTLALLAGSALAIAPPSTMLSPLIGFNTLGSCNMINDFVLALQPESVCQKLVTPLGEIHVIHKCDSTGLIQLYSSPGCLGDPLLQSERPFCSEQFGPTAIAVCCAPSSTTPQTNPDSPKSWPLQECQKTSAPTVSDSICRPATGTNKFECTRKLQRCRAEGRPMKWTQIGCKSNAKRFGDGGCQCDQYCGYGCKLACARDKQCKWENGQCFNKLGINVFGGRVCGGV